MLGNEKLEPPQHLTGNRPTVIMIHHEMETTRRVLRVMDGPSMPLPNRGIVNKAAVR